MHGKPRIPPFSDENQWFYSEFRDRGYPYQPEECIDSLISSFLRQFDVIISPPKGSMELGPLMRGFYGAVGPAAYAAGQHLHSQFKSTEIQEWTTWKQWALDHRDWPAFRDKAFHDRARANRRFIDYLDSPEGIEFANEVIMRHESHLWRSQEEKKEIMMWLIIASCVFVAVLLFMAVVGSGA
jgi:hypothetical protein